MGNSQQSHLLQTDCMSAFLIPRDFLLDPALTSIPRLQEMRKNMHVMELSGQDLVDGINGKLREVVVVSHRWVSTHDPDVTGEQLEAIRAYLRTRTDVLFVWYDFGCLPQQLKDTDGRVLQTLNDEDAKYFKKALSHINLLYLNTKVLILLDGDFSTRFWCLYETFLAHHKFQDSTLVPEEPGEGVCGRVHVTCVGSYALDDEETQSMQKKLIMQRWGKIRVENFIAKMNKDDIKVTNHSDKHQQLESLNHLSDTMKSLQEAIRAKSTEAEEQCVELRSAEGTIPHDLPASTGEHGSFTPTPAVQHTVHREAGNAGCVERGSTPSTCYLPQSLAAEHLRVQAGSAAERIQTLDLSSIGYFTGSPPGTPEMWHMMHRDIVSGVEQGLSSPTSQWSSSYSPRTYRISEHRAQDFGTLGTEAEEQCAELQSTAGTMPHGLCPSPACTSEHGSFPPTPAVQHTVQREAGSAGGVERGPTPSTSDLPQSLSAAPLAPGVNGSHLGGQAGYVAERIRTLDRAVVHRGLHPSITRSLPGTPVLQHRMRHESASGVEQGLSSTRSRGSNSFSPWPQAGCTAAGIRFPDQPSIFTGSLRTPVIERRMRHESAGGVEQGLSSTSSRGSNSFSPRSQAACAAAGIRLFDRPSIFTGSLRAPVIRYRVHQASASGVEHGPSATTCHPPPPRVGEGDALVRYRVPGGQEVIHSGVHQRPRPATRMCRETLGGPQRGAASTAQDRRREAPLVSPVDDVAVHAPRQQVVPSTSSVTSLSRLQTAPR